MKAPRLPRVFGTVCHTHRSPGSYLGGYSGREMGGVWERTGWASVGSSTGPQSDQESAENLRGPRPPGHREWGRISRLMLRNEPSPHAATSNDVSSKALLGWVLSYLWGDVFHPGQRQGAEPGQAGRGALRLVSEAGVC